MLFLGTIFYFALFLTNAMAILSEDRFLARSAYPVWPTASCEVEHFCLVGWSSTQPAANINANFHQPYDQTGYSAAQPDIGVKGRMINLIGAVRTLMRSICCSCLFTGRWTNVIFSKYLLLPWILLSSCMSLSVCRYKPKCDSNHCWVQNQINQNSSSPMLTFKYLNAFHYHSSLGFMLMRSYS